MAKDARSMQHVVEQGITTSNRMPIDAVGVSLGDRDSIVAAIDTAVSVLQKMHDIGWPDMEQARDKLKHARSLLLPVQAGQEPKDAA